MPGYIDRDKFQKALQKKKPGPANRRYTEGFNDAILRVKSMVSQFEDAGVEPVVHGKWEYNKDATDWGIGGYICSECKNKNNNLPCNRVKTVRMFSGAAYCPNCGAKMDGGE